KTLDIPADVANSEFGPIIDVATHKEWERRFPTALEFHQALSGEDDSFTNRAYETGQLNSVGPNSQPMDLALITGDLLEDMGEIEVYDGDDLDSSAPVPLAFDEPEPEPSSRKGVFIALFALVLIGGIVAAVALSQQQVEPTQANEAQATTPAPETPPTS